MYHPLVNDALERAARSPRHLGYYLDSYGVEDLCSRLGCDQETVLLLHLATTPAHHNWLRSIRSLSVALRLDPAPLSRVLAEAMRAQGAADAPRGRSATV